MNHSNEKGKELLRIGELARRCGKSTRALRLYEKQGLLTPDRRSSGGFRLYLLAQQERLQIIDRLQRLGLSLEEIRSLLGAWTGAERPAGAMSALLSRYVQELQRIRANIAELQGLERELEENINFLLDCLKKIL